MKINRSLLLAALFPAFFIFSSCEKTEMFKSEKTIKKQLVGTWNRIPIPKTLPDMNWIFEDNGTVYLQQSGNETDTGAYEIKTSLTKVDLKIKNLTRFEDYNATWQVVLLDNEVLVMANDHSGATGIKELDFQKRN
ncbi:MAG: hypothetical protein IPJ66_02015 [Bacteroidetes bacterium]|nr:hypothetical protein [Bacteroidota bacterium]MBL0064456.1 hypothetical protein [Bacteroidota bacterium]MBL0137619.1 hypothetical protein [Bacteroidota bacterium]